MIATGWLPDKRDVRDFNFKQSPLSVGLVPSSHDGLSKFLKVRMNQGLSNGCVGWSLAHAIHARHGWLAYQQSATQPPPPSPLFIWWNSRKTHGMEAFNEGTYLRSAIRQAIRLGVAPENVWKSATPEYDYYKQPTHRAYQKAIDHRWPMAYYRIDQGYEAEHAIKLSISKYHPVQIGMYVTEEFTSAGMHDPWPRPGDAGSSARVVGGHALTILSYDEHGVYGPNSWSNSWGNSGWFALSWEYVRDASFAIDLWSIAVDEVPLKAWWLEA